MSHPSLYKSNCRFSWSPFGESNIISKGNNQGLDLIFLCDLPKALHIEIFDSMTSSAIINAFRSYFVIRDTPAQISNDPGKYFLGAKIIMQKEFSSVAHDFVDY